MLLFPEAQKKAKEEVDRVCDGRLPTIEDESKIQYLRGCVKESLHWACACSPPPPTPTPFLLIPVLHIVYRVMSSLWEIYLCRKDSRSDPRRRVSGLQYPKGR